MIITDNISTELFTKVAPHQLNAKKIVGRIAAIGSAIILGSIAGAAIGFTFGATVIPIVTGAIVGGAIAAGIVGLGLMIYKLSTRFFKSEPGPEKNESFEQSKNASAQFPKQVNQGANSLQSTKTISDPQNNQNLKLKESLQKGARLLKEHNVDAQGSSHIYNYLMCKLFGLDESFSMILNLGDIDDRRINLQATKFALSPFGGDNHSECQKNAKDKILFIQDQYFTSQNSNVRKIFIPFIAPGGINHAILIAVEIVPGDKNATKITIIDPFGDNTGYVEYAKSAAEGIKEVLGTNDTRVVVNKQRQQLDGKTCGFHQVLNIRELANQNDIQGFVEQNKLPIRPTENIRQFINDLHPENDV